MKTSDGDAQTGRPSRTPAGIARHLWAVSVGTVHAAWRLLRHRSGVRKVDAPPEAETAGTPGHSAPGSDEQPEAAGTGPRFRRSFRVRVPDPERSATDVMADVHADPNCIAPDGFASFHKEVGEPGAMDVGDEYLVDILGPWTNRVRVVAVSPTSFRLATLKGHVEAGRVDISVKEDPDGRGLYAEVQTHTRSKDRVLDVLYDRIGLVRLLQTEMWAQVCEHAAARAGGKPEPLAIEDVRLPDPEQPSRT